MVLNLFWIFQAFLYFFYVFQILFMRRAVILRSTRQEKSHLNHFKSFNGKCTHFLVFFGKNVEKVWKNFGETLASWWDMELSCYEIFLGCRSCRFDGLNGLNGFDIELSFPVTIFGNTWKPAEKLYNKSTYRSDHWGLMGQGLPGMYMDFYSTFTLSTTIKDIKHIKRW